MGVAPNHMYGTSNKPIKLDLTSMHGVITPLYIPASMIVLSEPAGRPTSFVTFCAKESILSETQLSEDNFNINNLIPVDHYRDCAQIHIESIERSGFPDRMPNVMMNNQWKQQAPELDDYGLKKYSTDREYLMDGPQFAGEIHYVLPGDNKMVIDEYKASYMRKFTMYFVDQNLQIRVMYDKSYKKNWKNIRDNVSFLANRIRSSN